MSHQMYLSKTYKKQRRVLREVVDGTSKDVFFFRKMTDIKSTQRKIEQITLEK